MAFDKIIIILLTIVILSLSILLIALTSSNPIQGNQKYYSKCLNGSIHSFNQSTLLVCGGVNPLNIPQYKINITLK